MITRYHYKDLQLTWLWIKKVDPPDIDICTQALDEAQEERDAGAPYSERLWMMQIHYLQLTGEAPDRRRVDEMWNSIQLMDIKDHIKDTLKRK